MQLRGSQGLEVREEKEKAIFMTLLLIVGHSELRSYDNMTSKRQ
jgi:hypothetical protein